LAPNTFRPRAELQRRPQCRPDRHLPRRQGPRLGPAVALLGRGVARLADLAAEVLQRLLQHAVLERRLGLALLPLLGLLLFLFGRGLPRSAYDVAFAPPLVVLQPLLVGQLHLVAVVRPHAPLVLVLGVGEAVDVLAAGPPVARGRQLERAEAVLHRDD